MKKRLNNLPLMLLLVVLPGAAAAISGDYFVRRPMLAGAPRGATLPPGFGILSFTGSYVVGILFGLLVVAVRDIVPWAAVTAWAARFVPHWLAPKGDFLEYVFLCCAVALGACLIPVAIDAQINTFVMGIAPSMVIARYLSSKGRRRQGEPGAEGPSLPGGGLSG